MTSSLGRINGRDNRTERALSVVASRVFGFEFAYRPIEKL